MVIDMNDNSKVYIVKDKKLIPCELPEFGKAVIIVENGKAVRVTTEESKLI